MKSIDIDFFVSRLSRFNFGAIEMKQSGNNGYNGQLVTC